MDNSTDQSRCMAKSEEYPIIFRKNIYKNSNDNKNTDCSSDQLIVWQSEKNNDGYDTIFETINFNKVRKNEDSEADRLNVEQCSCKKILDTIKELLKPTSDESNGTNPSKKTSLEDIFCDLQVDPKSDYYGKDFKYYDLDEEYLNTFVREFKNNDNPKSEADAYSKEKELTIDEPVELEELQEKPKKDTKSDNKNKIQDTKSSYIHEDTVEDSIKNETDVVTNEVPVKYKQKSIKRRVGKIRKKEKLPFKRAIYGNKSVTKKNEVQESEYDIKYLYTFGDDYRGGLKRGHEKCQDTYKGIPPNKGWITNSDLAKNREKIRLRKKLHDEKELIYQMELALKNEALEIKDDQSNATVDSNKSMNSKGEIGAHDHTRIAKPLLDLNKSNGLYTITMNSMTQNDKSVEPVVFRLNTTMNNTEYVSSNSSLHMEFLPPAAMYAARPRAKRRHVSTSYDRVHFQLGEELKKKKNL